MEALEQEVIQRKQCFRTDILVNVIHSPNIRMEQDSTSLPHLCGSQWFSLNTSGYLSSHDTLCWVLSYDQLWPMNCGENNKFHLNLITDVRHFRALSFFYDEWTTQQGDTVLVGVGWDHTGTITLTITTPSSPAVVATPSAGPVMPRGNKVLTTVPWMTRTVDKVEI